MTQFKGFDDWIEIFQGGKQVDSNGVEHDGDAVIDKAVETFNTSEHEPPIVVGHPKENDPAYGWTEGVKKVVKDGINVLMAKFKQVVPEFEEMVEKGLFKKRSASFYPDGRLRHIGFLGAMPPAVKGLTNLSFNDDENAVTFDFYDPGMGTIARILKNLRDWLIEKEGKDKADSIIPDWDVEYIKEEANAPENPETGETGFGEHKNNKQGGKDMNFREKIKGMFSALGVDMSKVPDDAIPETAPEGTPQSFNEADIEKARAEAKAEAKKEAEAEFAETQRKDAKSARDREISDFMVQQVKEGKLLPAWVDSGLTAFAQGLDGDEVIQFSEGEDGKKTQWQWLKEFLEGFGESAIFQEMATKEAAAGGAQFTEAKKEEEVGKSIAAKVG